MPVNFYEGIPYVIGFLIEQLNPLENIEQSHVYKPMVLLLSVFIHVNLFQEIRGVINLLDLPLLILVFYFLYFLVHQILCRFIQVYSSIEEMNGQIHFKIREKLFRNVFSELMDFQCSFFHFLLTFLFIYNLLPRFCIQFSMVVFSHFIHLF